MTKSINEGIFDAKGMTFHVTDVGGSHSERLKWINCFNDVSAILFVVSLTDYDDFRTEYSTDVENLDFIDTPRKRIHMRNLFVGCNPTPYSAYRFKISALRTKYPGYCAIHTAENDLLGRKF